MELGYYTKLNKHMTKLEKLTEKINDFKKAIALELDIKIEDIDMDVTYNKLPDSQMEALKNDGLEIITTGNGFGEMKSTFIDEENTVVRFRGQYKSTLLNIIAECLKPDTSYDQDERKFEQRRDDKFNDLNEAC